MPGTGGVTTGGGNPRLRDPDSTHGTLVPGKLREEPFFSCRLPQAFLLHVACWYICYVATKLYAFMAGAEHEPIKCVCGESVRRGFSLSRS